jgi:plasmid stabilization system protein ParE
MSALLDYHPDIRDEVRLAYEWYESRSAGLGMSFLNEVERMMSEISENPQRFGFAEGTIREGLLSRFPFVVYYRVLRDRVRILAVHHTSRDSSTWRTRK